MPGESGSGFASVDDIAQRLFDSFLERNGAEERVRTIGPNPSDYMGSLYFLREATRDARVFEDEGLSVIQEECARLGLVLGDESWAVRNKLGALLREYLATPRTSEALGYMRDPPAKYS